MSAIGWQGRLNEASTEDRVTDVCRAFLMAFGPASHEELAASCRPPGNLQTNDISPYALKLIRQLGIGDRVTAPALHEITTFFTRAALRLAQISTQAAAVAAEQRRSRSD